jgi:hypothetical protein
VNLDKQEAWLSDPAWNNLSTAESRRCAEEYNTQIRSNIEQHHIAESQFNFVKMHLLNYSADHIHQLPNRVNQCSAIPGNAIMDIRAACQQCNCHTATIQLLRTNTRKEVFQY